MIEAVFYIGWVFIFILITRLCARQNQIIPLLAYLALGIGLNQSQQYIALPSHVAEALHLLGELGLILLLFRVGMNADLKSLKEQLPRASWIWIWNISISGIFGFVASYWILNYGVLTSAFIGVALTATSVGVTVSLWNNSGKLQTSEGSLLLDVAELDDLSTIVLVAILVSLVPILTQNGDITGNDLVFIIGEILGLVALFAVGAWIFSLYVEPVITRFIVKRSIDHELAVFMVAFSIIIATISEMAGLSIAIGAFIAGLAFSRDQSALQEQPIINGLYDFFTPFFFIGLGLLIQVDQSHMLVWPVVILSVFAISGKILGMLVPAGPKLGWQVAITLGVSMVPRMEIAMIVMRKGLEAGIPNQIFSVMVLTALITVLFTLAVLPKLLKKL